MSTHSSASAPDDLPPLEDTATGEVQQLPPPAEQLAEQAKRDPTVGPLTMMEAANLVIKHFGGAITTLKYTSVDPIIRDGGIVKFTAVESGTVLAEGRWWVSPDIVNDNNKNLFLPVTVRDLRFYRL